MTTDLKRRIGRRVQAARRQAGITQEQLAEKVARSPEAVSNIERGVSLPTLDTLDRIAEALEVPLGLFFDDKPDGKSRRRAEVEIEMRLRLRDLSDRDAEIALGIIDVMRNAGRRR